MAVVASVSSPASGTASVFGLITSLTAAGWRVKRWSDATTLSSDNVNLTSNPYGSASSNAGNLGNTSAWFRIAAPDGSREWLFQRGSADQTWTVSRSVAGFTGGTPNATTAGTATDATALYTAGTVFPTTTWRQFLSIEDAAPYGFTMFGITLGGGNVLTFLADEPLQSGTIPSEDTDPYLWIGYYNATGLTAAGTFIMTTSGNGTTSLLGYKRFTGAGSNQKIAYGNINASTTQCAPAVDTTTQELSPTPVGVLEVPLRIPVFRNNTAGNSAGWCGYANRHRWCTVGGRTNGQTLANGTTSYWVYAAGCWVPWDSTTPSLS